MKQFSAVLITVSLLSSVVGLISSSADTMNASMVVLASASAIQASKMKDKNESSSSSKDD